MSDSESDSQRGYDYEFLEPGPTDDQKCPICHLVVRNAHQVICCGKLICEYCLFQSLELHDDCPLCRTNIGDKYFKDTKSDREIKELKVFCTNRNSGCSWTGIVRTVGGHESKCEYQTVTCKKCYSETLKLSLLKHLSSDCPMREYKCPLCKEEGTYLTITTFHEKTCPEVELECKNAGCTKIVRRCHMSFHAEECPKEIIKCPFKHIGCEFKSERENLPDHIEKQVTRHVNMIADQSKIQHVVVKMTNFNHKKVTDKNWYSSGFYTGSGGYKVRLSVIPNGDGDGKSTHMSVYINLMPGANDDALEFPMRGKFTVEVLNQSEDEDHYLRTITFNEKTSEKSACRKYQADHSGWGYHEFVSHSSLDKYLNNDIVYFRVTVDVHSKTKPWLAVDQHCGDLIQDPNPLSYNFSLFSKRMKNELK